MSETWYVGDQPAFELRCVNERVNPPQAEDPTTVRFLVRPPPGGGPLATYTYGAPGSPIVRDDVGVYHLDVLLTVHGPWNVRAEGTGAIVLARETTIIVSPSVVLP
jgi:hypothetical protein